MSKQVHFTIEIPDETDVHIETKVIVMPAAEIGGEIDLASMTEDDINDVCNAHYDSGDCPLAVNCPSGGECFESADD